MEVPEIHRRAVEEFVRRAQGVDDRWDAPTPCAGWDVRQLVGHLVEEERWTPPLFAGETLASVGDRFAGDLLGTDPLAALADASAAAVAAAEEPGAMERTVHLSFGDVPGAEYAFQLAADHLVHAWDLARATGGDERLDPDVVAAIRPWFAEREELYRGAGLIGSRPAVAQGGGPQAELLAMFGRDTAS
jgi:uncharacterized protein (TIGR03086 family)